MLHRFYGSWCLLHWKLRPSLNINCISFLTFVFTSLLSLVNLTYCIPLSVCLCGHATTQLHRSKIGRAPNFRSSVESSTELQSKVRDKCRRISVCLSKLDNRLVATNLNHMLWADMVRREERGESGRRGRALVERGAYLLTSIS